MAIFEKDGLFYVEGAPGSYPRIEEARVVNDQVKAGTYKTQEAVTQLAGSPEMQQARAEETQAGLKEQVPAIAATGATMAIPGLREAGIVGMLGRAGVFSLADYARQLLKGETPDVVEAGKQGILSLGIEGGAKAGGALFQGMLKKSPGVAERLAESKIPALQNVGKKFGVEPNPAAVKQAYSAFEQLGKNVPQGIPLTESGPKILQTAEELSKRVIGKQQPQLVKEIADMGGNTVIKSFSDVDKLLHNVNRTLEGVSNPEERRAIYQLKDAIWKDIENGQVPAAQKAAYKAAVQTARDNFAKTELDNLVKESLVGRVGQMTGVPVPKTKSLLEGMDNLAADPSWVKSMGGEKKVNQIREFVRQIHVQVAKGSSVGTAVVEAGLGGATGAAVGGPAGAAVGAASAVSAPGWISRLAEKPAMSKLFLHLIDPKAQPYTREAITGLMNILMAGNK